MESIRVAIRIKPEDRDNSSSSSSLSEQQQDNKDSSTSSSCTSTTSLSTIKVDGNQLTADAGGKSTRDALSFSFDRIYSYMSTQDEIFNDCKYLVDAAVDGFNSTVFAFGMTGSGKTYTIAGSDESPGIVPRSIQHLFLELRKNSSSNPNTASMVFLTYVELYNNHLYDLLSKCERLEDSPVRIHEHAVKGIILTGSPTLRTPVSSAEEALNLITRGTLMRSTAVTNLNERSSRSHTVITLEVVTQTSLTAAEGFEVAESSSSSLFASGSSNNSSEALPEINSKKVAADGGGLITKVGRINLVDLAGSERVKVSGATGQTFEEAKQINKALSVLGDVLNALSKKDSEKTSASSSGRNFIPYRNSKLTMLLKDSLGGNAKTMMIATIRPLSSFFAQTLVTLRYAARTKLIKCNPTRNLRAKDSAEAVVLNSAMNEIHQLKAKLEQRNEEYQQLQMKVQELQNAKAHDSLSPAPKSQQQSNDNSRMEKEYLSRMEEIQARSYGDRLELQDKMKCLISNHAVSINKLQSDNVQLEQQLLLQIHKFDQVLEQKHKVESNNEELLRHLSTKLSELSKLHYDHTRLKQDLAAANEKITELSTLESDRKQFVEAIKKLNESRLKYKERCDSQSIELGQASGRNAELQQIIQESNLKLTQNSDEIESLRIKYHESETLLKKAALKIKELVTTKTQRSDDITAGGGEQSPPPPQMLSVKQESTESINRHYFDISNKLRQLKSDCVGEKESLIELRNAFMEDMSRSQQALINSIGGFVTNQAKTTKMVVNTTSDDKIITNFDVDVDPADEDDKSDIYAAADRMSLATAAASASNDVDPASGLSSPSTPVTIKKSLLKNIEKEMISNMENRLKELKSAKENFVKFSGILSESGCKGDSASWLSIESVLSDLQNQCKTKDAQLFDMQTELDRVKRENRDYKSKVKSSESMVKLQDLQLKGLKTNLDKSRKDASTSLKQGIDLLRNYVMTSSSADSIAGDLTTDDSDSIVSSSTSNSKTVIAVDKDILSVF